MKDSIERVYTEAISPADQKSFIADLKELMDDAFYKSGELLVDIIEDPYESAEISDEIYGAAQKHFNAFFKEVAKILKSA